MTDNTQEVIDELAVEDAEYDEMLRTYEEDAESNIPEFYFCNPDPYAKCKRPPDAQARHNLRFDDEGRIVMKNLEAYWLPDIRVEKEIGGTIYTVTGSYEGTETLDRKLLRIMSHNLEESE